MMNKGGGRKMKRLTFPKLIFTLVFFLFAVVSTTLAQNGENGSDLEQTLKKLSQDAAQAYVNPVVSAFGSNLNGGWFHRAPMAKIFGLNVEVGLVGMGTFFPEDIEHKHFETTGEFRFDLTQAADLVANSNLGIPDPNLEAALIEAITKIDFTVGLSGATIIGQSEGDDLTIGFGGADVEIEYPPGSGFTYTYTIDPYDLSLGIGGLGDFLAEISFLPFAAPQATVGTILGTQVSLRYLPEIQLPMVDITKDIGKFSWFGWGVQHNPGVFFPTPLPLDISAGFFKQTLKVGEIFEANTTAFGVTVSKRLGVGILNLTPYAGYLRESSKLNFAYDFTLDPGTGSEQNIPVEFELEGENKSRITVGCSLRLLLFNINADYNMGKYKSITIGVMFAL
jgi:hypothetical protein